MDLGGNRYINFFFFVVFLRFFVFCFVLRAFFRSWNRTLFADGFSFSFRLSLSLSTPASSSHPPYCTSRKTICRLCAPVLHVYLSIYHLRSIRVLCLFCLLSFLPVLYRTVLWDFIFFDFDFVTPTPLPSVPHTHRVTHTHLSSQVLLVRLSPYLFIQHIIISPSPYKVYTVYHTRDNEHPNWQSNI